MRLTDAQFKYVPSNKTNVAATWRRFGYRPTTEAERRARQARAFGCHTPGPGLDMEAAPAAGSASGRRPPLAASARGNVTALKRAAGD